MGHIISKEGVKVGPQNIKVITKWPIHKNIKSVRGLWVLKDIIGNLLSIMRALQTHSHLLKEKSFE